MAAGPLRPSLLMTLVLALAAPPAVARPADPQTVRPSLAVVLQPVAYVGYPIVVGVRTQALPNRSAVTLELDGKPVASTKVFRGRAEAIVALPPGRHRLGARAVLGGQHVASPTRAITVVPARTWQTARDDGRYSGTAEGGPVSFEVTGAGREIHAFSARVSMFCVGATIAQNHSLVGLAVVARVRIPPDGRLVSVAHPRRNTIVRLTGRLLDGQVTGGEVELTVGTCSGNARYDARRRE